MINLLIINSIPSSKDITGFTEAVKQLAELQHSQGSEWSVNGAAFIVISLFIIIILGFVFGILIRSMLNQQKQLTKKILSTSELLEKFQKSFDKNTSVLEKVNSFLSRIEYLNGEKAKLEVNTNQLEIIITECTCAYKYRIIESSLLVVRNYDSKDINKIKNSISNFLDSLYKNFLLTINSFSYRETRLGDYLGETTWINSQQKIIIDYIYSKSNDTIKFRNELDILFGTIIQEIRQEIDY